MKLVEFAKSFTVDMLDLDIIYVFDMKSENMIRLLDLVHYINKLIGVDEKMNISHSDVIHSLTANLDVKDKLFLKDIATYTKNLIIESKEENHVIGKDILQYMTKIIEVVDDSFSLYDTTKVEANLLLKDKKREPMIKDGIYSMWYSD